MSEDGKQYSVFGYTNNGQFFIGKNDTKMKNVASFIPEPSIKPKDYNELKVNKEGDKYTFKINGVQVFQTKNMPSFGDGLALKCFANSRMMVDYVNAIDPVKSKAFAQSITDQLFSGTSYEKNSLKVKAKKQQEEIVVVSTIGGSTDFKDFM